jgi:excisionase family DNA binding protein
MKLLTVKQAAEMLGYSVFSIRKLMQIRRIPWIKLPSGSIRFDAAKLERWAQSGAVEPDRIWR